MAQFGLQFPMFGFGVPPERMFEDVADRAAAAEESGFDSVWVMDHFLQLPGLGGPEAPILEGYTLLGALAARTERVRLGTLVTGVTYRNPALVAKMLTTLDVISRGRAICGIGAAWYDVEHEAYGWDFPPVGERMARLEEAVQIIRLMFTEEVASFDGRYYRVAEARNVPGPVQPGGPPIMVGGGGEKRTLRIVARYADMGNVSGPVETVRRKLEILHAHCEDVGRDPGDVLLTWHGALFLTASAQETVNVREMVVQAAGEEQAAGFLIGTEDELVESLRAYVEAGLSYLIVAVPMVDTDGVRRAGEFLASTLS